MKPLFTFSSRISLFHPDHQNSVRTIQDHDTSQDDPIVRRNVGGDHRTGENKDSDNENKAGRDETDKPEDQLCDDFLAVLANALSHVASPFQSESEWNGRPNRRRTPGGMAGIVLAY